MLPELSAPEWILVGISALLVGAQKTGIYGVGMIAIPTMAAIFGGRPSAGILLPILIVGDIAAVAYYRRHGDVGALVRLLPWAFAGIGIGVLVGAGIPDRSFRIIMAVVVLVSLVLIVLRERFFREVKVPRKWWFAAPLGLVGGFATMIGNAAGPVMALYLLALQVPKNAYIGTAAWFFLIVNVVKVPFHAAVWGTIDLSTLLVAAVAAPVVLVGGLVGIRVVKHIPERPFRIFVIVVTAATSIRLFFP